MKTPKAPSPVTIRPKFLNFATRMTGHGLWVDLIRQRFETTCTRLGLNRERNELDVNQFRSALLSGQADLFKVVSGWPGGAVLGHDGTPAKFVFDAAA